MNRNKKVKHAAGHRPMANEAAKLKRIEHENKVVDILWLAKVGELSSTVFPVVLATLGFKDGDALTMALSVAMFIFLSAVSVKLTRKAEKMSKGK